jgi:putative spermidine/putrescine transport system permease protein
VRRPRLRISARGVATIFVVGLVYVFFLAPLVVVALSSLDGRQQAFFNFPPQQLSLAWYWNIPWRYFETLWTSLLLATVAALVGCTLGIPAALGLVRSQVFGKEVIAALFRAPLQIPFVVTGVAFLQVYYLAGDLIGANLVGTFPGLALAHIFLSTPYVIGTVGAVLQRFNVRLEEAALSLGASRWATFRRITLPLIMPGIYAGALYAFIVSFGDIPVSLFLASPRYTTFPVEIFHSMEFDFNPAVLAVSTLIIFFSLGVLWLVQRIVGLDVLLRAGGRE